jgi:hypothetical protein
MSKKNQKAMFSFLIGVVVVAQISQDDWINAKHK